MYTCFKNSSSHFSESTVSNYLWPQGVVLGSKQISRQICTKCTSQIILQVHKACNYRSGDRTSTREPPLPHKRAPPGADPYTAGRRSPLPSHQIRTPPSHPQRQPSLLLPLHPSLSTCHLETPESTPDREGQKKICHEFAEETKLNQSKEHTCRSARLVVVVVVERENNGRDPARRLPTGPPLPTRTRRSDGLKERGTTPCNG